MGYMHQSKIHDIVMTVLLELLTALLLILKLILKLAGKDGEWCQGLIWGGGRAIGPPPQVYT